MDNPTSALREALQTVNDWLHAHVITSAEDMAQSFEAMTVLTDRVLAACPAAPADEKVSVCCEGERCYCGAPAAAKVEETIFVDDWSMRDDGPNGGMPYGMRGRHPLTAYVCADHFAQIMRRQAPISPSGVDRNAVRVLIAQHWGEETDAERENNDELTDAILALAKADQLAASGVEGREGWKLVPREPTEAMLDEVYDGAERLKILGPRDVWQAMYDVTPTTSGEGE